MRVNPSSNLAPLPRTNTQNIATTFKTEITPTTNNNLVVPAKKNINVSDFNQSASATKVTADLPRAAADKKGVLLYQQIEREKPFENGAELINNQFHFEA